MEKAAHLSGENVQIWAGKDFKSVLELIKGARLYVGNDSGFFHAAAALGTKAVCISSGGAYPRFMNYPKSDAYRIVMQADIREKAEQAYEQKGLESTYGPINAVSLEMVTDALNQLLKI